MKTKIYKTCNIEKLLSEYHSGNYKYDCKAGANKKKKKL